MLNKLFSLNAESLILAHVFDNITFLSRGISLKAFLGISVISASLKSTFSTTNIQ